MDDGIAVTETEYRWLMLQAVDGKFIAGTFYRGVVEIDDIPENKWALDLINKRRSVSQFKETE